MTLVGVHIPPSPAAWPQGSSAAVGSLQGSSTQSPDSGKEPEGQTTHRDDDAAQASFAAQSVSSPDIPFSQANGTDPDNWTYVGRQTHWLTFAMQDKKAPQLKVVHGRGLTGLVFPDSGCKRWHNSSIPIAY